MLYFDKIEVVESTDAKKTSASKECDVCYYWYFLNYSFKFQTKCLQYMSWFITDVYEL